jgi:hypothetical protein
LSATSTIPSSELTRAIPEAPVGGGGAAGWAETPGRRDVGLFCKFIISGSDSKTQTLTASNPSSKCKVERPAFNIFLAWGKANLFSSPLHTVDNCL